MGMMDVSRRRRRMGSAVTPDYAAEVQTHHVGNLLTYVRGTYIAFGNFFDCVIMGART